MGSGCGVFNKRRSMLISGPLKVYVSRDRVDLRKSYEGLGLLVQDFLGLDPFSGYVFVFFNKRLDKVKALYWDTDGFCIWQKRLEKGSFKVMSFEFSYWEVSLQQFMLLLSGVDMKHLKQKSVFHQYVMA